MAVIDVQVHAYERTIPVGLGPDTCTARHRRPARKC
jgi:hypothetical protein